MENSEWVVARIRFYESEIKQLEKYLTEPNTTNCHGQGYASGLLKEDKQKLKGLLQGRCPHCFSLSVNPVPVENGETGFYCADCDSFFVENQRELDEARAYHDMLHALDVVVK